MRDNYHLLKCFLKATTICESRSKADMYFFLQPYAISGLHHASSLILNLNPNLSLQDNLQTISRPFVYNNSSHKLKSSLSNPYGKMD